MKRFFDFLRSSIEFLKIIIIFSILMLVLYWIQNLTQTTWGWTNFMKPILEFFISIAEKISNGSIDLWGTIFEYKYGITAVLMVFFYYIVNLCLSLTYNLEDACLDAKHFINRAVEDNFNKKLNCNIALQEKKINKYCIFVSASVKSGYQGFDLNEQYEIMNKFLTEKTKITPVYFEDGFLYKFSDFEKIDSVLPVFFKLIKSDAPLDFIISVQIFDDNIYNTALAQLKHLSSLKLKNKISMLSDTAFRYRYNSSKQYETSQLGLFQKDNDTIEVHQFKEI